MKILYKIYSFCIATPLFILATIIVSLIVAIAAILGDPKYLGYYVPKAWGRFTFWIYLMKVEVKGREYIDKNQSYVFLANHQGYLDILLVYGYLGHNFKWMMKDSLRKMPFVGKGCYDTGHIFVNRESPQKEIFVKAIRILKSGTSLGIFAEGTRTDTGRLGEFKKGAFAIADMAQVEVVPLAIEGSFKLLPKKAIFMNWTPLKLTIMKPLAPIGKGKENVEYLMNESRSAIAKALGEE